MIIIYLLINIQQLNSIQIIHGRDPNAFFLLIHFIIRFRFILVC